MNQSPYAPPQSSLLAASSNSPTAYDQGLPDMSSYDIAELQELLSNPDTYTAEAVHASARELARRSSVPRYYTRIYSSRLNRSLPVARKLKLNQATTLQFIFSEANLKKYSILIAIFQSIASALQVFAIVRMLKTTTSEVFIKNWQFFGISMFTAVSTLVLALFFFSLHKTLSCRAIHKI